MLPTTVKAQITALQQDRSHGAAALGDRVLTLLCDAAATLRGEDATQYRSSLRRVARSLAGIRPSMAVLENLVAYCYTHSVAGPRDAHPRAVYNRLLEAAREVRVERRAAERAITRRVVAALPDDCRVLTHSRSSTVEHILRSADRRMRHVWVTASEPGGEGRRLAAELMRAGLPVSVVRDADAATHVVHADLVLVGADTILRNGSVVNKVGTRKVARAASEAEIPVLVACETWKISPRRSIPIERIPVGPDRTPTPLFDITPPRFLDALYTESGKVTPARAYRWARVTWSMIAALGR